MNSMNSNVTKNRAGAAVGRTWPKAISDIVAVRHRVVGGCSATSDLHMIRNYLQTGKGCNPKQFAMKGFTLLEVMVALTITGMALGGLFGVIAGNKRLAWRSEESLVTTMQTRSMINFSQLNDERGEVFVDFENDELLLSTGYEMEVPVRKTQASRLTLRQYEVLDKFGEPVTVGSYWVELELPE